MKTKMKIKPKPKNHGTRANKPTTQRASSYLFGNCALLFYCPPSGCCSAVLFAFGHCSGTPNQPKHPSTHAQPTHITHHPATHLLASWVFECGRVVVERSMEQF